MARNDDDVLSNRQEAFVVHYLAGKDATQAALAAGYAETSASVTACRLLKLPKIRKRIDEVRDKVVDQIALDPDYVLNRWQDMIRVLSQEVEALTPSGERVMQSNGEPATKYLEPHALRNVLRDMSQYLGMLDKAKEDDGKLEKSVGVLRVSAPVSKEEWLQK